MKRAGLVIVGKSNTPEMGIAPSTEPRLFGPTRNPWKLSHSAGGSSGGAAAAVAAGILPMAHATDGGGSIRIPASACGLFGLKPTRARNPAGPDAGEGWSGASIGHAVTWTVRDSAALLDATSGPDVGDPYWAPSPSRLFLKDIGADPGKLRIAFTTSAPNRIPVHPDCVRATNDAAKLCSDLGHEVVEADPRIDAESMAPMFMTVWSSGCAWTIDVMAHLINRKPAAEQFEPGTWALYQMGYQ